MLIDIMENLYEEALRHSKAFNAQDSLFVTDWCYKALVSAQELTEAEVITTEQTNVDEESEVTEKIKILDSLHQFGNEEIAKSDKNALLFPGGSVHLKNGSKLGIDSIEQAQLLTVDELKKLMVANLGKEITDLRFASDFERSNIKVMFISDLFVNGVQVPEQASLAPLVPCFNETVSQLFLRMIYAMGIKDSEYILSAVAKESAEGEESDYFESLKSEILSYQPQLIITLGAQATNRLLQLKSRLKDIHGNFYQLEISDQNNGKHSFEVMPLFSPTLLQTAPNMKKTAWKDMQKAMEKLSH